MSVELDDRIRTLVRRLDEMAPMAPEFETLQTRPPKTDRSRRMLIPALVGAVAVLAVALVHVAGRPNPPSSGAELVPHSIARHLPAGWTVLGAGEKTAPSTPTGMPTGVAYATPDAPFGPVAAFFDQMGSLLDTNEPTVERTRSNGLRTVIGSAFQGNARWVDVEMSPGSWVGFAAAELNDDELFQLAEQVIVDGNTSRFEGPLPRGLTVASSKFQLFGSFITYGADAPPPSWPTGLTMTTYGPPTGPADTSVSIFPASPDTRVALGLTHELTGLVPDGTISAESADDPASYVYSRRDGYEVWARSTSLNPEALSKLVLSLSPASDTEWVNLVSTKPLIGSDGAESPDTTAVDYPTVTEPELPDGDPRSTVSLDYTPIDNGTMTASLPGDHPVSVQFEPIGRSLRISVSLDDTQAYTGDLDVNDTAGGNGGIAGDGDSLHVITYTTTDPAVARISVIDGTTEYTAPYVTFDESSSVRVAVVVIPARTGRTTPPAIRNLDANGNNLGNI